MFIFRHELIAKVNRRAASCTVILTFFIILFALKILAPVEVSMSPSVPFSDEMNRRTFIIIMRKIKESFCRCCVVCFLTRFKHCRKLTAARERSGDRKKMWKDFPHQKTFSSHSTMVSSIVSTFHPQAHDWNFFIKEEREKQEDNFPSPHFLHPRNLKRCFTMSFVSLQKWKKRENYC